MTVGDIQYKKTKIGQIPEDWDVVKIGNVVQKASQRDPRKKPSSQFKYVDISSISNDLYKITDFQILTGKNAPSRAKKVIKLNDIIYATVRPYLKRIAIVPQELDNEICSTGFCVIRCDNKSADYRYVFYILLSEWLTQRLTDLQKGSSYPAISDKDIYSQLVPLPHISEQRKIAEILSTVDADIEKTDAIIKETQQLKHGLMQKLFTEGIGHTRFKKTKIGRIPEEWQTAKFKEVSIFNNGANFSKHEVSNKGILLADVLNMYNEDVLVDTTNFYRINKKLNKNFILEKGDILFVRSSLKREGVGLSALFDGHHEPVSFCGFLIKARLINSNISPKFLAYYLRAPQTRSKIISLSGTVAITNINQESLGLLEIPIPQMREQIKITNIFSELNDKIENEQSYKSELEQLKKGLLQILLTGKVRVKV